MASDSCVTHPKSYFIQVRKDYLEMFDDDMCAAVLAWVFEFASTDEIGRMKMAGEKDSDPWIKASIPSLIKESMYMYSERSVHERLAWLKDLGYLTVESKGGGTVNRYLFNFTKVTEDLSKRRVFKKPDRKIAVNENEEADRKIAVSSAVSVAVSSAVTYKEEERITDKAELSIIPPTPPSEETLKDSDRPEEPFDHEALIRHLLSEKVPLNGRLKGLIRARDFAPGTPLTDAAAVCRREIIPSRFRASGQSRSRTPSDSRSPPMASRYPAQSSLDDLSRFPEEWNRIVTHRPVKWAKQSPVEALRKCAGDEEFRGRFTEVCEAAEAAHRARGDDVSWVTFEWVIRCKDGGSNWYKLLGEFSYLTKPPQVRDKGAEMMNFD